MTNITSPKQEFARIIRDVDWQRATFLLNCLEIVRAQNSTDADTYAETIVRKILDDFLLVSVLFYQKVREDLLNQFCSDPEKAERFFKGSMQSALEKICNEWNRVYAAILAIRASQSNAKAREIVNQMQPVLSAAQDDVGLKDFLVILQFGQSYSLRFSNYTEGIAALNMPLASLASPWEWTILWHELAGERVRAINNQSPDFFVSLYESIMYEMEPEDRNALEDWGFSVDWLEELFEDSFSVVNFPIQFLYVLKDLLERFSEFGGKRTRHPPLPFRLAFAMSLHLRRKGFSESPPLKEWDKAAWRATWADLQKDRDPVRFQEFDPAICLQGEPGRQKKLAWVTAGKILEWWGHQNVSASVNNSDVRELIATAIKNYARFDRSRAGDRQKIFDTLKTKISELSSHIRFNRKIAYTADRLQLAEIEDIVRSMDFSSSKNVARLKSLENAPQNQKIKKLLLGGNLSNTVPLSYKELLKIPFDDADYVLETVRNVKYLGDEKFNEVTLRSRLSTFGTGAVSFIDSKNESCFTNPHAWNFAAPNNQITEQ